MDPMPLCIDEESSVQEAGLIWVGPDPHVIEAYLGKDEPEEAANA